MRFAGFIGPSYLAASPNVDSERCINLYAELTPPTSKEREVAFLRGTPGLGLLLTAGLGPIRGSKYTSTKVLYVVSKNEIYKIDSYWNKTLVGTLSTSSGPVSMDDNGIQLMIVDGPFGYVVTLATNAFVQISDPAFTGATRVTFQDGYFIFNVPGTGKFGITGLNDVTFDALDIATSEGNPDNIVSLISNNRSLWLFNEVTTEIFFNSGNADFPFERVQGAFIEFGLAAAFSVAKSNTTVFWLSKDEMGQGMVLMANGYQPQRISTHAVEHAIQSYGDLSAATGWTYQEDGHIFYCLNFPTANTTWAFDSSTSMWHERVYTNQGQFERHRADNHVFAYGKHVVGDYANANLYELSSSIYSDNGSEITSRRTAPHVTNDLNKVGHNEFQLDIEAGVGADGDGQGIDPQVMLRFSDDGGHTFSNEKWASIGKIGETKNRAIWRRLGSSRDRVYELTITDPVKRIFLGARLELEEGES